MNNFNDYVYQRPDIERFTTDFKAALETFKTSKTEKEQLDAFEKINALRQEFDSMGNICHIRNSIDTKNEFYNEEKKFFDENSPTIQALVTEYYRVLLVSSLRPQLEKKWGKTLFTIAEFSLKTFIPEILEDLQEENKLITAYNKLKAGAELFVRGEKYNLSSIIAIETGDDRELRKEASETKWKFYEENSEKIESLFDQLVKIRHRIAQKLGYKNFVELGYVRMLRMDYNAEMVANYRRQIQEKIVPIASKLYARQQKRLGLKKLCYYDEEFKFASGNAKPKGSPEWIINNASLMYKELSPETDTFFQFMRDNNLMDLVSKEGKETGGYCTFISKYQAPYIFSNFNGTSGDIDVLTHEAGHAFQVFSSKDIALGEYHWPTFESCEIHSMSMEFFTWKWMHLFFKEDTDKYKFAHLSGAIHFLPYGVSVDEFQHFIYENPDVSPQERNDAWTEIESKYLPHRNYEDNTFLKKGAYWQKQSHIFNMPFYYIDYTLAQMCAFQFWKKDAENHESAWADYLRLCKAGGSDTFLGLVKLANLRSPFEEGCVASVTNEIEKWLDGVDDSTF
jgi:M3 family oligoendopeptidase